MGRAFSGPRASIFPDLNVKPLASLFPGKEDGDDPSPFLYGGLIFFFFPFFFSFPPLKCEFSVLFFFPQN